MKRYPAIFLAIVAAAVFALGCGGGVSDPLEIPNSPDGTVRVVMSGLAQQHPEVLWRALPPSYQADVNGLMASVGENMDPVVFDRAVAVARKASMVLQRKKDLILSTDAVQGSEMDRAGVDAAWEGAMRGLDILLASDLTRLEAYPSFDVEAFLTGSGAELMAQAASIPADEGEAEDVAGLLADLESTTVELVSSEGDRAVVRVTPPEEEGRDLPMTRIEGRWLPAELVEEWPGAMEQASERIEYLGSEEAARTNMQILFGIGVVEGFVDQIDQMESAEDLDALVGGLLGNVAQMTGAQPI
ncbi:MAG: hypothetical protein V2I67_05380 [Thermoanaerobaculales bacterium]|jgi:hypothetical protein|nr:hypothetical protein [Thermoanaerobaculales bacterium]